MTLLVLVSHGATKLATGLTFLVAGFQNLIRQALSETPARPIKSETQH